MRVNWPKGYGTLYEKIRTYMDELTTGLVVAVDPASGTSSKPGVAIFRAGKLEWSGEINLNKHNTIFSRMDKLYVALKEVVKEQPDILLVEEIHKSIAHEHLMWAVGVTCAALAPKIAGLEIPIQYWKALAKISKEYVKGDQKDAEMIGASVILKAKEQANLEHFG
jgi:hypothetical protein